MSNDTPPLGARPSLAQRRPSRRTLLAAGALLALAVTLAVVAYRQRHTLVAWARSLLSTPPNPALISWFREPASRAALATAFDAPCPGYPFLVPSSGLVGGLPWGATYGPYNRLSPHPGIDIFGMGEPGTVPVRAAYDGLLTREPHWIASVIIRHDDPLNPGETIWTYYTHMADASGAVDYIDPAFPPGTVDAPVKQGQVIGYQGVYGGGGLHLHFSIVKSDAEGVYRNEAVFANTLDPMPYLGLTLNAADNPEYPLRCRAP